MGSKLFYEDDRDSVRAMLSSAGKTVKEAACHLWPRMKPDSAYAKLYAQLNAVGDEEMKFSEVIELMRWCDHFDPLAYICDETLHARPPRKAPNDERLELVGAIKEASQTMQKAMARLDHLETITSARA